MKDKINTEELQISETERKAIAFAAMLWNTYKDEDNRDYVGKIDISLNHFELDITAMLLAIKVIYEKFTDNADCDLIEFTHILNKLAIQYVFDDGEVSE